MKLKSIVAAGMMMPAVALAWPWSTDMMNQPSIKAQEGPMAVYPEGVIPITGLPTKVSSREETREMINPIEPTTASIDTGRQLYKIYCGACHGNTGGADSPVSGKVGAPDLNSSYIQDDLTEGWIWGTITFGSYVMPSYGVPASRPDSRGSNDLNVEERWHVVNYMKHGMANDHAAKTQAAAQ